jgi:sialic acid synthase SpsE
MQNVRIIAEIGSNYDNDIETAAAYIRAARDAGADMVKFQTLRKDRIVARDIRIGGRLEKNPVYDLFTSLELPDDWHGRLKQVADEAGIEFFSTPFYLEAVALLEGVGARTYKIASGDITFTPLLEAVGRTGKSVILSTGGSTLAEVEAALALLQKAGAGDVSLMHCVSNYPPAWEEMNLRAITTLRQTFELPVGISDHTPGDLVPIAAVALGASLIEKHVTFARSSPGPFLCHDP